jgi:hypothetical protein
VSVSLFVALSFTFSVANSPGAMTALLSLLAGVTGIAIIVRFVGKRSCETDAVA